ncbi:DUF6256 family protein [Streptomyces sp. NPDC127098]|uniref:DUF6256 family protein n=1 Tax=Streptomyces sp. NPDC127098 TaxID=3347137 RepID=UPI00365E14B6
MGDWIAVISVAVIYVLVMIYLRVGVRLLREEPEGRPHRRHPERWGWPEFARQLARTFVGGWLLLMVVIVGYYGGIARHNATFVWHAFTGTLSLMAITYPLFLGATWVFLRVAGWRSRPGRRGRPDGSVVSWEGQNHRPDHPNR